MKLQLEIRLKLAHEQEIDTEQDFAFSTCIESCSQLRCVSWSKEVHSGVNR